MKNARRGFTLVELLCVLTVTAIVSSLLFAVFARAREGGRRAVCVSNLKQLSLAMQQYVQDTDGSYPLHHYVENAEDPNINNRKRVGWQHAILPHLKSQEVFDCPSRQPDHASLSIINAPALSFIEYRYNFPRLVLFNRVLGERYRPEVKGRHEVELPSPASVWVTADTPRPGYNGAPVETGEAAVASCGRTIWGDTVHSGGGNYAFMDGHVKWLKPAQLAEVECSNGSLPLPFGD